MIKLMTVDGDAVWVLPTQIAMVTQAKSQQNGGPPVPVLGVSMMSVVGMPMPLVLSGSPEEIVKKIVYGTPGDSLIQV